MAEETAGEETAGEETAGLDFFDRARRFAVALLLLAGVAAIAGSSLDWVTITVRRQIDPRADFGSNQDALEEPRTRPFSGLEAGDGYWALGGGIVIVIAAGMLLIRPRGRWAILAFLASLIIGAIAFADYRGVGDVSSSISARMEIDVSARPGVGLTLVAAAGFLGIVGSAAAIAATPPRD
ncbi:MAG TPA: hypothetical protein VFF07_01915 [Actinomycetota bacterium]|nr:hypothetical protein [Actinomycetota bacterium]